MIYSIVSVNTFCDEESSILIALKEKINPSLKLIKFFKSSLSNPLEKKNPFSIEIKDSLIPGKSIYSICSLFSIFSNASIGICKEKYLNLLLSFSFFINSFNDLIDS